MTVTFGQTVDIGHGRGRLVPEAAASLWRIDAELGYPLDVNSAWRSPITQQQLYEAYLHYLRYGSPWAPIALPPSKSVHCDGEALDTDDAYNGRILTILNRHGWYQTVWRWNPKTQRMELVEPWHVEYDASRDQHYGQPSGGGAVPLPTPPEEEPDYDQEEEEMLVVKNSDTGHVYGVSDCRITHLGSTARDVALNLYNKRGEKRWGQQDDGTILLNQKYFDGLLEANGIPASKAQDVLGFKTWTRDDDVIAAVARPDTLTDVTVKAIADRVIASLETVQQAEPIDYARIRNEVVDEISGRLGN